MWQWPAVGDTYWYGTYSTVQCVALSCLSVRAVVACPVPCGCAHTAGSSCTSLTEGHHTALPTFWILCSFRSICMHAWSTCHAGRDSGGTERDRLWFLRDRVSWPNIMARQAQATSWLFLPGWHVTASDATTSSPSTRPRDSWEY